MDTHGHESIAERVGGALLRRALDRSGKKGWSVQAFYLGNWLTDVSQAVDPVAYHSGENKVIAFYDATLGKIEGLLKGALQVPIIKELPGIGQATGMMVNLRVRLMKSLKPLRGGRSGDAARAFHKAFKVKGYYKFAHPERRRGPVRMPYKVYRYVYHSRYTQYYPHEHFDRWPGELDLAGGYANRRATRTRTVDAWPGTGSKLSPHLYLYMVDDIEMAAGLLAHIDRDWARHTFSKTSKKWPGDHDPDWNLWLAKLGHALHACEDYFAHSNFIELAMHGMSDRNGALRKLGFNPDGSVLFGPYGVFTRRLKRLTGYRDKADDKGNRTWRYHNDDLLFDWRTLPDEDHVVTGYFDFTDTFFSLKHVAEELFGDSAGGGTPHSHHVEKGVKFTKLMHAMCTEVQARSERRRDHELSEAQARRDAEAILKEFAASHPDPDVREAAESVESGLPTEASEIRDEFLDAIALFLKHASGASSLFGALVFWMGFAAELMKIAEFVKNLVPDIPNPFKWVKEWWVEHVSEPVSQLIERFIGRDRIGCHSLLAKDYERHDRVLDTIYDRAMNCASAVHWYVIKTMTRAAEPSVVPVCRSDVNQDENHNTVNVSPWIDWLELLEFFLRHPHGQPPKDSKLPPLTETNRWWWTIVKSNDYKKFPGFNDAEPCRDPALPHRLVIMKKDHVDALIDCSGTMRKQAEDFYDLSIRNAGNPPSHHEHVSSTGGESKPPAHIEHHRTTDVPTEIPPQIPPPDPVSAGGAIPKPFLPTHADVRTLQERLYELGYNPPDNIDGLWGPKSREALQAFQRSNPPLQADGIYGPKSCEALKGIVEARSSQLIPR